MLSHNWNFNERQWIQLNAWETWRQHDLGLTTVAYNCYHLIHVTKLSQFLMSYRNSTFKAPKSQKLKQTKKNLWLILFTIFTWILPGTMLSAVVKISCLALDVSGAAKITFPAPVPSGLAKINCCFGDTDESTAVTIWIFWPVCWSVTIYKTHWRTACFWVTIIKYCFINALATNYFAIC